MFFNCRIVRAFRVISIDEFYFTADAGDDVSIALPVTRAVLNGTRSKDDIKIVQYHWEQVRYNIRLT